MRGISLSVFILFCLTGNHLSIVAQNSVLWEISGNGLAQPSYLFGTAHMMQKDDFYISEALTEVLEKSDSIFMEVKLDDLNAIMELSTLMMLPDGMTLKDIATEEQYALLKSYVEDSLGESLALFETMKPFALQELFLSGFMGEGIASYELWMLDWCRSKGKPIGGLETVADQMAIFDSIPDQEEIGWIIDIIEGETYQEAQYDSIVVHYQKGDIEGLYRDVALSSPEMSEYEHLFLDNRNRNWIPVMEAAMQHGVVTFAVGAGHLGGPVGVVPLLRARGYTLTPIEQH